MMDTIMPPTQEPCDWCLDDQPSLLLCTCTWNCEQPDCPNGERPWGFKPEVPVFSKRPGEPIVKTVAPAFSGVVNIPRAEYRDAIDRVVELHKRCTCKACSSGHQRPSCKCCNEFWPCPTIHALRGNKFAEPDPVEPTPSAYF